MTYLYKELRAKSVSELVAEHDKIAPTSISSVSFFLTEISRKDQEKQTDRMLNYTKWIFGFTIVMTIATIVNLIIFISRNCK